MLQENATLLQEKVQDTHAKQLVHVLKRFEYIVLYDDEVFIDTDENYKLVNDLSLSRKTKTALRSYSSSKF